MSPSPSARELVARVPALGSRLRMGAERGVARDDDSRLGVADFRDRVRPHVLEDDEAGVERRLLRRRRVRGGGRREHEAGDERDQTTPRALPFVARPSLL